MKYFFVSDIHGQYDKLVLALAEEGFDIEKDTLVSLGDPFDRGPQSKEVLDFFLSCPHRILVMGNHDWRLLQLMRQPFQFNQYDIMNGVPETYKSFLNKQDEQYLNAWDCLEELQSNEQLKQYYDEVVLYVEFSDLIGVHAWVPFNELSRTRFEPYYSIREDGIKTDWHDAFRAEWYEATWAHTEMCVENEIFPNKRLIVGHWHAWRLARANGEDRIDDNNVIYEDGERCPYINCDTYYDKDIVAIDGCTNYPNGGKVNVIVYESDEQPQTLRYRDCK